MAEPLRYLVDTNILLRIARRDSASSSVVAESIHLLRAQNAELCYTFQNIAELWNVATRPIAQNGFGLSAEQAERQILFIEGFMHWLDETPRAYAIWRQLALQHRVCGVQVHDTRLAAVMMAHGVSRILTLNGADFARFSGIVAIGPAQINAGAR